MADPLSVVAALFATISVAQQAFQLVASQRFSSLERSYGSFVALFVSTFLRNTAGQYERIERIVIRGRDEDALAFRQAVTDECNMTAVAGAIIAQVAITALSLPDLSSTHWVARAFFLFAIAAGCLSVYFCCVLQRTIGKLYRAQLIRTWLSLPPKATQGPATPPRASLAAVFILSAPFTMMKASIFAFLIGLAIYQGFTWTRGLDTDAGRYDSRNVFITFIVGTGSAIGFFLFTFSSKIIENLLQIGIIETLLPDDMATPDDAAELEDWEHRRLGLQDNMPAGGLAAALEASARAHIQCAEADRRLASAYARTPNV
ncbi:uncharacterized protein KY384_001300 [Bacidia gigantensis]|uniref:uncharacterized protein n=1 Tax=Bacidia gigantensis TaxID=2732470 RepID=UPI001D03981B|nr:uncharacterized protein KY384_001300 [Bacidia gigantensis]KAG8533560.1 hypothetical protein KY384_001300 [Bacidia gigantensis]